MNKKELTDIVAKKINVDERAAQETLEAFLETIQKVMIDKDKLVLPGFGTFGVRERPERQGRNPKTGEAMTISASTAPYFKPSPPLKKAVNQS